MKACYTIIGIFCVKILFSQPLFFNKTLDYENTNDIGSAILKLDSSYILISQVIDTHRDLVIQEINLFGDTLWSKIYRKDNISFYTGMSSLVLTPDSNLLFAGNIFNHNNSNTNAYIFKFNLEGDSLWFKEFGDSINTEGFHSIVINDQNSFLVAGQKGQATTTDIWLMKLDYNGNEIWEKSHGVSPTIEVAYSIKKGVDSGYIIGGYSQTNNNRDAYVLKVNNSGTFQWDTTFGGLENESCKIVSSNNSLGYLVYGGTHEDGAMSKDGYYKMLNSNGSVRWEHTTRFTTTDSEKFNAATELTDGSFALAGYTVEPDSINNPMGWIMKVAANGDSLWSRRYSIRSNDHYLIDIIETENKGLLACGYVFPDGTGNTEDVWLLKVDSMGCLEENCHVASIEQPIIENELLFYPNPFNSSITITATGIINQLSVYDLSGRLCFQQSKLNATKEKINTSTLKSGTYLVEVITNKNDVYRERLIKQ